MRPVRGAHLALAVLTLVTVVGCSSGARGGEDSGTGGGLQFSLPGDVSLLVSGPVDGYAETGVGGSLTVVDGCLGLQDGDSTFVVVWPEDSSPGDGDDTGLTLPDGAQVGLGSEVDGSGEFTSAEELPAAAPELPESCAEVDEVALLGSVEAT